MQRARIASFKALCLLMAVGPLGASIGCDNSKSDGTAQVSPEAKKADEGLRNGMKDFMQSKGKAKPQTR